MIYHQVLAKLWKPFLVLTGGLFTLRYVKRGLFRALARLPRNHVFSVGAPHTVGRFTTVMLYALLELVALRLAGFQVMGVLDTFAGFLAVLGVGMVAVWAILSNITASIPNACVEPLSVGLAYRDHT